MQAHPQSTTVKTSSYDYEKQGLKPVLRLGDADVIVVRSLAEGDG